MGIPIACEGPVLEFHFVNPLVTAAWIVFFIASLLLCCSFYDRSRHLERVYSSLQRRSELLQKSEVINAAERRPGAIADELESRDPNKLHRKHFKALVSLLAQIRDLPLHNETSGTTGDETELRERIRLTCVVRQSYRTWQNLVKVMKEEDLRLLVDLLLIDLRKLQKLLLLKNKTKFPSPLTAEEQHLLKEFWESCVIREPWWHRQVEELRVVPFIKETTRKASAKKKAWRCRILLSKTNNFSLTPYMAVRTMLESQGELEHAADVYYGFWMALKVHVPLLHLSAKEKWEPAAVTGCYRSMCGVIS